MAAQVDISKCNGCKACVEICPVNAVTIEKKKASINDECIECGACIDQCPQGAISI